MHLIYDFNKFLLFLIFICFLISCNQQEDSSRVSSIQVADADKDGIMDVDDTCPLSNDINEDDYDGDGCTDSEDDDNDNDGLNDQNDLCPTGFLNWVSNENTDYDLDGCKDDTEDDDDDNDGIFDLADNCSDENSERNWISDSTNDYDGDGCQDFIEDTDLDNDGVLNFGKDGIFSNSDDDACPKGFKNWRSDIDTDHDGDGCRDLDEDNDDDNDNVLDSSDDCSKGKVGWLSNAETSNGPVTDYDEDGCLDYNLTDDKGEITFKEEDNDDDNDSVDDSFDTCPRGLKKWVSDPSIDFDLDGCHDVSEDQEVDLTNGDLQGVNLSGSNLSSGAFKGLGTNLISCPRSLPENWFCLENIGVEGKNNYMIGPGIDLSNTDLGGADLTGANLQGANLINANLFGVKGKLSSCPLTLPDNYKCSENTKLYIIGPEVDLSGADLSNIVLLDSNLTNTILINSNFLNSKLTNTDFTNALLTDTNFSNTVLANVVFESADLSGVDFTGSSLQGVKGKLTACPLTLPDDYKCSENTNLYIIGPEVDLSGADLSNTVLIGSNLTNSILINTLFVNSDLTNVDLTSSDLTNSNFSNANLENSNFTGANFTSANFTQVNFLNANLTNTILNLVRGNLVACPQSLPNNWICLEDIGDGDDNYLVGSGADLSGADLTGADLSEQFLSYVSFNLSGCPADLPDSWVCFENIGDGDDNYIVGPGFDLTGADLREADLSGVDLTEVSGKLMACPSTLPVGYKCSENTNLYIIGPSIDLTGADLSGADLSDIDLSGVKLEDAILTNIIIKNTKFSTKTNLKDAQISDAILFNNTNSSITSSFSSSGRSFELPSFEIPPKFAIKSILLKLTYGENEKITIRCQDTNGAVYEEEKQLTAAGEQKEIVFDSSQQGSSSWLEDTSFLGEVSCDLTSQENITIALESEEGNSQLVVTVERTKKDTTCDGIDDDGDGSFDEDFYFQGDNLTYEDWDEGLDPREVSSGNYFWIKASDLTTLHERPDNITGTKEDSLLKDDCLDNDQGNHFIEDTCGPGYTLLGEDPETYEKEYEGPDVEYTGTVEYINLICKMNHRYCGNGYIRTYETSKGQDFWVPVKCHLGAKDYEYRNGVFPPEE